MANRIKLEVLPPEPTGIMLSRLTSVQERIGAILSGGALLAIFMWGISEFFSLRGVQHMLTSLVFLGISWLSAVLIVLGILRLLEIVRWRLFTGIAALLLLSAAIVMDYSYPMPTTLTSSIASGPRDSSPLLPSAPLQPITHGATQNAPVSYSQDCHDSACAQGPGSKATYNKYRASKPAPNVVLDSTQTLSPIPADQLVGPRRLEAGILGKPGLTLSFHVDAAFSNPMFRVNCDRPCFATDILFASGGTATFGGDLGSSLLSTDDPNVVIFGHGNGLSITPDITVIIEVRSQDDTPLNSATVEGYVE